MLAAPVEAPTLCVRELLGEEAGLRVAVVAGAAGLDAIVRSPRMQKPGLALVGATDLVHEGRVQVFGKGEQRFLSRLPGEEAAKALAAVADRKPACLLLTSRPSPPHPHLVEVAEARGIALLATSLESSTLIDRLTHFLEDRLAPRTQVHGVLLDIYGLGVLVRGESGVGKSEAALDLVVRGHTLVADDVVRIRRIGNNVLIGWGPELLRHHMELRGLGIINVKDLYGVAAVRSEKAIDLVVDLVRWEQGQEPDRLGTAGALVDILEVPLPHLRMPVAPGRSMAILVEVASRNHLMAMKGHSAAAELIRRVERARKEGGGNER